MSRHNYVTITEELFFLTGLSEGAKCHIFDLPRDTFPGGLPYNRLGHGPRNLVVFQGLLFKNKPQTGPLFEIYKFLGKEYTVYVVLRKPGMPQGYGMQNFAADHPDLVRRLVIHSSAYVLSDESKKRQLEVGRLTQQRQWARAYAVLIAPFFPRQGVL